MKEQDSESAATPKDPRPTAPEHEKTTGAPMPVERVQLGVRVEKRMAKVLKATAEYLDKSLGELLENMVLHAFEGTSAFSGDALQAIADFKKVYGMDYDLHAVARFGEGSGMWQRFTQRARRVVFFAQEEAARIGKNSVGTSQLLLGLVRDNQSVAARAMERLGIPLSRLRSETERNLTRGPGQRAQVGKGTDMQLTPRSKRSIDLAYEEARELNHDTIGTEHLLLGLIREEERQTQTEQSGVMPGQGVLEILPDGWGFLRRHADLAPAPNDVYVSQAQIRQFGLKTGDWVSGQVRPPQEGEKYYGLLRLEAVNQRELDPSRTERFFDDLGGRVLVKLGAELERTRQVVQEILRESLG